MGKPKRSKLAPVLFVVFGFLMLVFGLEMNSLPDTLRLFKSPKWPYVLNLSPGILMIATAFIINKLKKSRRTMIVTFCVLCPVAVAGLLIVNGALAWELSARPETNPADY
jgi:hypothetical protein